jgi:glutamate formiminotransferase
MEKLVECVPNFSEGKNKKVINAIFEAAKKVTGVKVFELEYNSSHNRMLFTIIGSPEKVLASVYESIKVATKLINMEKHKGEHPRIGATDVVPFIPVSGVDMKECVLLARKLGQKVAGELKIPVYLYEAAATTPARVNLADVRRGEYEGLKVEIGKNKAKKPDFGPSRFHPTAGAMVVGARKYLVAYNINLATSDVEIAKKIASKVREKDGGLLAVKALGFSVDGKAQVSMNLCDFQKTNFDEAYREVEKWAKKYKVGITSSEIYGMIPLESLVNAVKTTFKADTFKPDQVLENRLR